MFNIEMKDVCLYITVGIPGSGKSTFAKDFVDKADRKIEYMSNDELRSKFGFGEEDQSVNNDVFRYIRNKTDAYLSEGISVMIDSAAVNSKNRKGFIQIGKKFKNVKIIAYVFPIPVEIAKKRNSNRKRKVPEHVIDNMYDKFKMPSTFEGFDEVKIIK